jgi:hypothetical protein
VLCQPIYEKDRSTWSTTQRPQLDQDLLKRFPEGYRHLAYLQTKHGYTVKPDMLGASGPALDALYARGAKWLKTEAMYVVFAFRSDEKPNVLTRCASPHSCRAVSMRGA